MVNLGRTKKEQKEKLENLAILFRKPCIKLGLRRHGF
jgi:hypothetical protein